jgi:hypothetical protein
VGVLLIILWLVPFWALGPRIADSLSGLSNPPSVAAVTTAIVVVQTIIGLLGFWVAGTQVKSIIKSSTKLHAFGAIWSILLHGDIRGHGATGRRRSAMLAGFGACATPTIVGVRHQMQFP